MQLFREKTRYRKKASLCVCYVLHVQQVPNHGQQVIIPWGSLHRLTAKMFNLQSDLSLWSQDALQSWATRYQIYAAAWLLQSVAGRPRLCSIQVKWVVWNKWAGCVDEIYKGPLIFHSSIVNISSSSSLLTSLAEMFWLKEQTFSFLYPEV